MIWGGGGLIGEQIENKGSNQVIAKVVVNRLVSLNTKSR